MRFDRAKAKQQLQTRTQQQDARKDGDINLKYFKPDVPNLFFFKPKATKELPYLVDIIPFLAGNNYPKLDKQNPVKAGDIVYVLELYIHTNVGPTKAMVVCPRRNYDLPCPICEDMDEQVASGIEQDSFFEEGGVGLKRRCVYNIRVRNYDEEKKRGNLVWEVSHKYSEKPILLCAKSPRTGGLENFSDPDVGKSIAFSVGNDTYKTIAGHKLEPRDYIITDEELDAAKTLDQIIVVLSYDEIKNIYYAEGENISSEQQQEDVGEYSDSSASGVGDNDGQAPEVDECPEFGVGIDHYEQCDNCPDYNKCGEAFEAAKAEEEAKKKAEEAAKKEPPQRRMLSKKNDAAPAPTANTAQPGQRRRLARK